jgi:preprotein translocase subunit SecE
VAKSAPKPGGAAGPGDHTRYVHLLYLLGALASSFLLFKISNSIWFMLGEPNDFVLLALSVAASAVLAVVLWRHKRVNTLAFEVVSELSRVTWPTRKELTAAIVAVIIVSIVVAMILGLFDMFWSWVTDLIYFGKR